MTMEAPKIYSAMHAVLCDAGAIPKSKKNPQQGFMFRGIDDAMNALSPILAKHGVFVVPEVISSSREERQTKSGSSLNFTVLTVHYRFYATDGSFVEATVMGEGMDSADKSTNKAMSAAFKYALLQAFCIATEEMTDPDAETPEPSVKKTAAPAARPAPQASAPKPAARPATPPQRADADVVKREIERRRAAEQTKASAYPSASDEAELASLFGGNG